VQVLRADDYNEDPTNVRAVLRDFAEPRGTIQTADGVVLARSVPSNDRFELQREYPEAELFGHVTGFFSIVFGATGVEKTYGEELAGRTTEQQLRSLSDLFVDHERTGDVTLTVRRDVQQVARQALGDQQGSVIALDPRTGELLALWSFPSFDPNLVANHDGEKAAENRDLLLLAPGNPLRAASYQDRFFPGSTFKVVTSSAGVESGRVTVDEPNYPVATEYVPPQTTRPLANFGGEACGGTLFEILRVSCNTAFAEMGAETLGPEIMVERAEAFGFNEAPPIDLPAPATSVFPTDFEQNLPALAQSSIGQNDVQATPLQMALVAAAIANDGVIMTPHVLREVRDVDGDVIETYEPEPWRQAVSAATAQVVHDAMLVVAQQGTATAAQVPGYEVGAKTGTAQLGTDPPSSHAWMIAFAGPPGQDPTVAVAVIVEAQPGVSEVTGGRVAGPIVQQVLAAVLDIQAREAAEQSTTTTTGSTSTTAPSTSVSPPTTAGTTAPTVTVAPTTSSTTIPTTSSSAPTTPSSEP
ncbi:MAG TPA: penicillin-binding protein 2, partial [Acidimicrobiales bacterium]